MMRVLVILCAVALAVAAVTGLPLRAVQATDNEIIERVDSLMTDALQQGFGGAVVIERQGREVLSRAYGLANRQTTTAFTTDTIAPIGSITKSFTALALVQLAVEGKVNLQGSVRTYLSTAAEPAASARLAELLVHHAGLAEYCGDDFVRRTRAELIAVCTAQPLAATRGTYAYSNSGYSILAAIVEEVSGQTWEDVLSSRVFEPARIGAVVGFLLWFTVDFIFYGITNTANLTRTVVDPLLELIRGGIGGAVIGVVLSRMSESGRSEGRRTVGV